MLPRKFSTMSRGKEEEMSEACAAEPGVIDRDMLVRLVIEQGAKGEAGKLFLEDGIRLDEVEEIRIEFLNILRIDNLWIMADRLTRLKLSNNIIERIENLDSLVNLRELDLSFNHIRVIENLESLVNLEILLLYENEITEIAGIDGSSELTILSIGANKIDDWDHVMYLRKYKKLRSLNVAGNSCTLRDGYFNYLVAFLPQIHYLNYKMVSDEERRIAQSEHRRTIGNLEEKEATELAEIEEEQAIEKKFALLSISYVENLDGDQLFQQMFKNDREGTELSRLNDDSRAVYEDYKKKFMELCQELYRLGLAEQERRSEEIKLFNKIVDEGREAIQMEARTTMDEIIDRKTKILTEVKNLVESVTILRGEDAHLEPEIVEEKVVRAQQLAEEFDGLLSKTWTGLMYKEVILHEQIEDTNETFKINMGDMISSFLEAAQAIFSQMRDIEGEYKDNVDSVATLYMNNFLVDQLKMPSHHVDLCGDKDILNNSLAASHDLHLQTIDAREDLMVTRVKTWYEKYTDNLAQEEHDRNRKQVLEISHFLEYQREEFDALQVQLRSSAAVDGTLEADIAAAING